MDLNTIWFVLIGVLLAAYAILDGFDLGTGVWHLFARREDERRAHLTAIGPVWDGNEVWLLTAGGALFAAFPPVYAAVFSGFYLAFMLLLAALIFRAVALEFRHHNTAPAWTRWWDWAFGLGSLVPALLYGVAIGNILRGIPIDVAGEFRGSFLGLLNPYALLVGALTLVFFAMHGAAYLAMKTNGDQAARMRTCVTRSWIAFVALYVAATVASVFTAPRLFEAILGKPLFWACFPLLLVSVVAIPVFANGPQPRRVFAATSATMFAMVGLAGTSLYPDLAPSSLDPAFSLTAYSASSTPRTLGVMLIITLVALPAILAYTAYVYYVFRGKVTGDEGYH
ncbi:MAG TPA: cytochrome d ubiquinol oxidase subunit II [Candidatus Hydrogenedentes bacterium]|nr:cytochrome d ubiquinol oxidase subunit II [Candidatus Hydrogenedentota bacterium]HPG70107.1 cytochrome d ubiquinol oxidase subunit II [Candidatus Hydrogenedentota bacterium]